MLRAQWLKWWMQPPLSWLPPVRKGGGGVKVEVKWAGEKIEAECIPRKRLLILQQGKRCSG